MDNYQTTHLNSSWLDRKVLWNILGWQVLVFLGIYALFGFIYWLALYINSMAEYNAWDQTIISYVTKALFSVPFYWVIFVKFRQWRLQNRLLLHLLAAPAYVLGWLWFFHRTSDLFEIGYLTGVGMVWDIYIPFLLYFIQFGFLHFYEYVTRSRAQEQESHALMQAALQSEVNALKAQMEPHFLFNTLNSISASVPPEMEHTRELIAKLADTFRFGLQASESERVPLREEIRFLQTYLELEKQRFGTRLQASFEVDKTLLAQPIPPMLLQPLVENAIKHGVGNSVQPVLVTIKVKRVGDRLFFAVADTGNGHPAGDVPALFEKGIGLRNTRLRLEKQFGQTLDVRKNEPQGLVFSFEIPIES